METYNKRKSQKEAVQRYMQDKAQAKSLKEELEDYIAKLSLGAFILTILFRVLCMFIPALNGIATVTLVLIDSYVAAVMIVSIHNCEGNEDHAKYKRIKWRRSEAFVWACIRCIQYK